MKWRSVEELPSKDGVYHFKGIAPEEKVVKFVAFLEKGKFSFFHPNNDVAFPYPFRNVVWLDEE